VTPSTTPAFLPTDSFYGSEQDDDTVVLREILTKCLPKSSATPADHVHADHAHADHAKDDTCHQMPPLHPLHPLEGPSSTPVLKLPQFQYVSPATDDTLVDAVMHRTAPTQAQRDVCSPTILSGHLSSPLPPATQQGWSSPSSLFQTRRNSAFTVPIKLQANANTREEPCSEPCSEPQLPSAPHSSSMSPCPTPTSDVGVDLGALAAGAFESPVRSFPLRYGVDTLKLPSPLQTQQQPHRHPIQAQQHMAGEFEFDLDMDNELSLLMDTGDR
jgi:hypothetical protein